ncbi:hypothetical protein CWN03_26250, partial [Klebsiella quasipneumoniae]
MFDDILSSLDDSELNLIIMPTEQCNFRCTYCYEDFEFGSMSYEISTYIMKLIDNSAPRLNRLTISWFGGEPLLAMRTVINIGQHAVERTKAYGIEYKGHMTTNGYYLTVDNLERLCAIGITDYQITLDGFGSDHDKTRKKVMGGGTFNNIWNNLLSAKETDLEFNIMIRIHFTPKSIKNTLALIAEIKNNFIDDVRFTFFFHMIERLGGKNDQDIELFDNQNDMELFHKELNVFLNSPDKLISLNNDYICYAAKLNSFVIRSNGQIAKCTVALNSEVNNIGILKSDGRMDLNKEKLMAWGGALFNSEVSIRACPTEYAHRSFKIKNTI